MINPDYPSGAPSGNAYLDSLIWGGSLASGSGGTTLIQVTTSSGETIYGAPTLPWTTNGVNALERALQTWQDVADIRFTFNGNLDVADIQYFAVTASAMAWLTGDADTLGSHETPDGSAEAPLYGFFNVEGHGWNTAGLKQGGYGFATLVHEIGHGLGLAHPHDGGTRNDATSFPGVTAEFDDYGDYELNQGIWTVMSYNDGWNLYPATSSSYGLQGTPMALDIAAIQAIYGANMAYHNGADSYALPKSNGSYWSCIWDTGGNDTISNKGAKIDGTIDLRAATLSGEHAGGYVSQASGIIGGYTIAHGVIIENAIGGSGNDTLQGNDADNLLEGGNGNDLIIGGAGLDTASYANAGKGVQASLATGVAGGGNGNDLLVEIENLLGGRSNDTLAGNTGVNAISGGKGNDTINAGDNSDWSDGEAGNDYIDGGEGNDSLYGGPGNDRLLGGGGADTLYAGAGKDSVWGGADNDRIAGGEGSDTLTGDLGADIFVFDNLGSGDKITDFTAEDALEFDLAAFGMLASLSMDNWVYGSKAQDADDYLIYNIDKGVLYYDANGNGAGGATAVVTILGSYAPMLSLDDLAVT